MRTSHQHRLWHLATDWIERTKAYIHASWKTNTAAMSLTLPWIFYVSCIFFLPCFSHSPSHVDQPLTDSPHCLLTLLLLCHFLISSIFSIPANCFKNQHDIRHKFSTFPLSTYSVVIETVDCGSHPHMKMEKKIMISSREQ